MIDWRTFGIVLSLLSAASMALGVADVVYTYQTYMVNRGCSTNQSPSYCNASVLIFTWIAVGIWASLPIFIFALMILKHSGSAMTRKSSCTELLCFLCAFIFSIAMVVISGIEVWKGVNVFYWTASGLPSDDIVKAAIPIAIAALGFVEHVMCFIAFYYCCCCRHNSSVASTSEVVTTTTTTNTNMYQHQPQHVMTYERPAAAPGGCQPCQARQMLPPPPSAGGCQPCQAKQSFYSAGGMGGGMGGGFGGGFGMGGGGGGCSSCPRPMTYNSMAPNPAYNFYRR